MRAESGLKSNFKVYYIFICIISYLWHVFISFQFISSHIKLNHVWTRKFDNVWGRGSSGLTWMDREKEGQLARFFAQIANIVCDWFDLFRYQGCTEVAEGCYFQWSMLAEEVIFCPRIWSVFSPQPTCRVFSPLGTWRKTRNLPSCTYGTSIAPRLLLCHLLLLCYYCATIVLLLCYYCATIVPPAARVPYFEMTEWMTPMLCTAL